MHSLPEQQPRRMFSITGSLGFQCSSLLRSIQAAAITRYRPLQHVHSTITAARQKNSNASGSHQPGENNSNSGSSNSGSSSSNLRPSSGPNTPRARPLPRLNASLPPRQQQRPPLVASQQGNPIPKERVHEAVQQVVSEKLISTIVQQTLQVLQQQSTALQELPQASQSSGLEILNNPGAASIATGSSSDGSSNGGSSTTSNGRETGPASSSSAPNSSGSSSSGSSTGYSATAAASPPRRPPPPPRPKPAWQSRPAAPYSESFATTHSASSANGSRVNSSSSSSGSSSRIGTSRRRGYIDDMLTKEDLKAIAKQGLVGLRDWNDWGDQQLLTAWQDAAALLPAAVERLAAVSVSGPTKLVCFDFETTTAQGVPDVLELAAVAPGGQTFHSLVSPISKIPADNVTRLVWEDLRDQPVLPVVLLAFLDYLTEQCSSAPGGSSTLMLIGHNIKSFDVNQVLRTWMVDALHVKQIDQLLGPKGRSSYPPSSKPWIILDTLHVARTLYRTLDTNTMEPAKRADYPWEKTKGVSALQSLRGAFGIPQDQQHRALEDCLANIEVFVRLVNLQAGWDSSVTDATALAERWLAEQAANKLRPAARRQRQQQQQTQHQQHAAPLWNIQQQQQQQQRRPQVLGTAAPNVDRSSYGRRNSSSSSSSTLLLPAIDPDVIDANVNRALENLTEQDLRFSRQELAQVWSPLGDDPAAFKKAFTATQHEKLEAAGLNNLLKVVTYVPKIRQYDNIIRLTGSSSSSNGNQAALQGEAPSSTSSSSSSVDGSDVDVLDEQFVDMQVNLVISTRLIQAPNGCFWNTAYQVPTDLPTAEPVYLKVAHFFPGRWALGVGNKVKSMAEANQSARIRGKVKPIADGALVGSYRCTWASVGSMEVEYPTATSGSSSSSSDDSAEAAAAAAVTQRNPLVAVYAATKPLASGDFVSTGRGKGVIDKALDAVRKSPDQGELLPQELLQQYQLPAFITALKELHQPTDMEAHRAARRRLAFQELLLVQIAQLLERYWLQRGLQQPRTAAAGRGAAAVAAATAVAEVSTVAAEATITNSDVAADQPGRRNKKPGRPKKAEQQQQQQQDLPPPATQQQQQQWRRLRQEAATAYQITDTSIVATAKQLLPYQLTADQDKVLAEVLDDIAKPQAMLRLLQGDVGCGKTVVAVMACLAVHKAGCQALILAPTELLASQHFRTLSLITEQLPLVDRPRIKLLTGSSVVKEKKQAHNAVKEGCVDILVSTQAALWVPEWGKLGLVIVDEQHKFGVKQREMLTKRVQAPPHMLLMTATPIPRTLALVQYGGLTLSTITQMPPGRQPVATKVVVDSDTAREEVYGAIRAELDTGGRVYIVCALVNESDTQEGVKAAREEFKRLSEHGVFGTHECGLLYGQMDKDEKADVLKKFNSGEKPVLISSTVVEVGIDEPEASIMLVENAARFGLAQLHQLRGRVGRGTRASRCFLIAPPADADAAAAAAERLQVLEESHNGLVIAEADLKFRGPGDVWGVKQSGKPSAISHLAWDELQTDTKLLDHARAAAAKLLPCLGSQPQLKAALLAYRLMMLQEDGKPPLLRDGVSGV